MVSENNPKTVFQRPQISPNEILTHARQAVSYSTKEESKGINVRKRKYISL